MLEIKPYTENDFDACVELYKSNIPKFFLPNEVPDFIDYLQKHALGNYWCLFDDKGLVGCCGINIRDKNIGRFVYGIVRHDLHKRGIGSYMTNFR
jgi:hypothetical protein